MKTNRFMPGLLLVGLGLAGCEDIISVEVPDGATYLVVDGWISDQPGPCTVRLSTTAPYFSNQATPRVQGAEVMITDNDGTRDVLKETEPGLYQSATVRGRIGGTYTLSVTVAGQTYTAQTQINRVPTIDSLGVVYREETDDHDAGYYLTYFGRELPGRGDQYRIKVFRNDTLLNNPELDLFFFNDDFLDGKYLNGLELSPGPFRSGDRARVEIHAITADTYGYLVELQRQMRNDGLFANPTENVSTNITAVSRDARPATGWFGGSAVQSKTIYIH
ncbi:hypothetical protein BN8_02038 [Fibrisoma limi BUZ 3]|uniref:DUF4249 domain-containing protein n=1 Tax=Fibrisoma limi BUZ 3 TaxID=1185876 RepID=I2GGG3_9BACT|nr:DUF4249 domain-containing protein [Fibrisoma limi]CCH52988.1 hypothetical protein BN8_02038 [Fibrisoma limi BUZ 3]